MCLHCRQSDSTSCALLLPVPEPEHRSSSMTPEHELESEDDDAPEEVTFQSARVGAEENARLRREAANRDKALLKEKRKRKIELFKEQKKNKLLSDDILHTVSSLPDKQEQPSEHIDDEHDAGDGDQAYHVKNKAAKKLHPRKRLKHNYKVLHLNDCSTIGIQQRKAKAFIRNKLYGKSIHRTTANEFLSVSRKKSLIKKPAAQFTDNTWADEEKKRAAKFKLVWASNQKL
ncbi:nucleolar protein 7 [Pseudophryne corroboree]|uniref:nucleolar protein 7 n=1 Tax=Pseudophryne corroboree TaxID=495146 RepID=UPI0030812711